MTLCIVTGGEVAALAVSLFTLSWTHSVEKVEWRETWRVEPAGLRVVEARVRGSGAGMEPPPDARFQDGWWIYVPRLGALPEVRLAASGATGGAWRLCTAEGCRELGAEPGAAVILKPCP